MISLDCECKSLEFVKKLMVGILFFFKIGNVFFVVGVLIFLIIKKILDLINFCVFLWVIKGL